MSRENVGGPNKGRRPSDDQKLALAEYMRDHPDFAAGRFQGADGKGTAKRLWNQLAAEVNAKGPKKRTVAQWRKTWKDMKGRAKSKAVAIRADRNKTGNRPNDTVLLSSIDKIVIEIIGQAVVVGLPGVRQSLPRSEVDMDRLMADTEDEEEMIELEVDGSNDVTIDAVVQVEAGQPMNTSAVGMLIVDGDYLSDGNGTFHNTRPESDIDALLEQTDILLQTTRQKTPCTFPHSLSSHTSTPSTSLLPTFSTRLSDELIPSTSTQFHSAPLSDHSYTPLSAPQSDHTYTQLLTPSTSLPPTFSSRLSDAPIPSTSTQFLSAPLSDHSYTQLLTSSPSNHPSTQTDHYPHPQQMTDEHRPNPTKALPPSSSSPSMPSAESPPRRLEKKKKPLLRRVVATSKSDARAAQFLKVQIQQNKIFETLAQAMLQNAQNETEAIVVRRQAVENTARLYDRLGDLIAVLKDGFKKD